MHVHCSNTVYSISYISYRLDSLVPLFSLCCTLCNSHTLQYVPTSPKPPPNFAAQAATDFAGEASEMGCSETKMLGEVTAKLRRSYGEGKKISPAL